MVERIIDLRKQGATAIKKTPISREPDQTATVSEKNTNVPETVHETIEWSAYEYEKRQRGPYWFLFPGIVALGFIIFGIFTKSYFFITFVALAFFVVMLYEKRAPQKISFRISMDGAQAGRKSYGFSEFKSFWIFNKPGLKELSLETNKTLFPFLRMPLAETDAEEIRRAMLHHLPEKEQVESISDQLARIFGF